MSDLIDDEAFVDDTSSDTGTEEGSDIFSDGQDPFYDRSPWFILVGRLVTGSGIPTSSTHKLGEDFGWMLAYLDLMLISQIQSKWNEVCKDLSADVHRNL